MCNTGNTIKISVTVPVYNTSKYIRQCLESLYRQTFKDIEFIIVDDGSTDGSSIICDEYAKKDSRFRVIHKKNGGSASARQTGLDVSRGNYIIVCDSDDWVEPNMYEELYKKAIENDADIITCGFYTEYDNGKKISNYTIFKESNGIVDNYDILERGAGWSWVKLIKRSLFKKANAYYEPGINLSEDSLIVYKLLRISPKIVQLDKPLYHYRRVFGGNSYTNTLTMKHINQLLFTYNWLKNNYKEKEYCEIVKKRAIDLAFASLRANDLKKNFLCNFLDSELPWKKLLCIKHNIKSLFVCSIKISPISFSKYIFKSLYPIFYK